MSKIKELFKQIPVAYPLWHKFRLMNNKRKENKKQIAYRKYNIEILKDIFQVAKSNKFPLICAYGTLLGIVRDNQLLPWDDDMDFIILDDGNFSWDEFNNCMKANGFWIYRKYEQDNKIVEMSYKKKNVLCDVRIWDNYDVERDVYGDYFLIDNYEYKYRDYEEYDMTVQKMIPINKIVYKRFSGIDVMIPENSNDVLEKMYGQDWKCPNPHYKPSGEKIRVKRKATYYKKSLFSRQGHSRINEKNTFIF